MRRPESPVIICPIQFRCLVLIIVNVAFSPSPVTPTRSAKWCLVSLTLGCEVKDVGHGKPVDSLQGIGSDQRCISSLSFQIGRKKRIVYISPLPRERGRMVNPLPFPGMALEWCPRTTLEVRQGL